MDYYKIAGQEPLLAETRKQRTLPPVSYTLRKSIAGVGMLFGVAGLVVFSGMDKEFLNPWASALGAGSGVVALVAYWNHQRHQTAEHAGTQLKSYTALLRLFAVVSGCIGMAGFLGFLASGIFENEKLSGRSSYVASVWGFLLAKWGVLLLYYTNGYEKRDEIRDEAAEELTA
mmetsp:Transcript_120242/g.169195  ORF Transcript_120242/g.169195 Transcript_120242/m.169195 type:complete len:173 (-) Transcript_120242:45-563(-)